MNNRAIFFASFMTLIAAGVGFAIRGGILGDWATQYGFTSLELGTITGGGLVGFGVVILAASAITDRLGYRNILLAAFVLHVVSAVITLSATPVFNAAGKDATYQCLYWGMFLFSVANGLCEAVINPLVAQLYPKQQTHYLNILHAGWPGGLIIGGLLAHFLGGVKWEIQLGLFLVPVLIYGIIVVKEKFPTSLVAEAGISFGESLAQLASPVLLLLLLMHACVGYVELGTDSWIASITESLLTGQGLYLFVYASTVMFVLRFFAGPIVEKTNPLGLLFFSAILGCIGLQLIGNSTTMIMTWIAVTVYSLGKTFLWPTMLGVVGERFPKGGAVAMGAMGGIGMLSAGLLGGPGIGYKQDYYASKTLQESAPETYARYQADKPSKFLFLPEITGLSGAKVGVILDGGGPGTELADTVAKLPDNKDIIKLNEWWQDAEGHADADKSPVEEAKIEGGRMALKWTSAVPAAMAVGYLLLILYFKTQGGYKVERIDGSEESSDAAGAPAEDGDAAGKG
jgi:MFS family permease